MRDFNLKLQRALLIVEMRRENIVLKVLVFVADAWTRSDWTGPEPPTPTPTHVCVLCVAHLLRINEICVSLKFIDQILGIIWRYH